MPDTAELPVITDEMKLNAAKNEWGKTFTLKDQTFEILDLQYFDYLEFITLGKPLIAVVANGLEMGNEGGEINVNFNPTGLDFDQILGLCGKELPKMAWLVCKQSQPRIKQEEVCLLAHRPQRLVEIVLLQILHNNMIQEFGSFFTRLTAIVSALMPDVAKMTAPSELQNASMIEETPSS